MQLQIHRYKDDGDVADTTLHVLKNGILCIR